MARLPRLALPGYPHHILQRGNNREPLFAGEEDFAFMHGLLLEQARAQQLAVHAWVLMPGHFQLLATPQAPEVLARFMQGVGRRYVRHYNARAGRSGTLWEGRFRSALLQPEAWLLDCMAYLDLDPVRGGLVQEAPDWPWSSHGHYTGRRSDRLVTPHPAYWQLGNTPFAREQAYAERVAAGLPTATEQALADSVRHGWALGDPAFLEALQQRTPRRLARGRPGRPRKAD